MIIALAILLLLVTPAQAGIALKLSSPVTEISNTFANFTKFANSGMYHQADNMTKKMRTLLDDLPRDNFKLRMEDEVYQKMVIIMLYTKHQENGKLPALISQAEAAYNNIMGNGAVVHASVETVEEK